MLEGSLYNLLGYCGLGSASSDDKPNHLNSAKMSVWRVCERAELGIVGRRWQLDKDEPLDVGRSPDSDIQVQVSLSAWLAPLGRWALFRRNSLYSYSLSR